MSRAGLLRLVGVLGVVLFLASAFTPLPNLLAGALATRPRVERADAIVALGGGVFPDGKLRQSSLRRVLEGIVLYRQGLAPRLVLLGPASEAERRVALANQLGVPPEALLIDDGAWTTREEAERMKRLLAPHGVRRILLVANSQHQARARALFERAGFEVLAANADEFSYAATLPEDRLDLMRRTVREFVALLYYRAAGYL
ncbi:MAG: YdcF family protein [Candidatus Rokubacteria bacterium]|nr:YdcF family protein [Candidatus Rokubacteria bacterium]